MVLFRLIRLFQQLSWWLIGRTISVEADVLTTATSIVPTSVDAAPVELTPIVVYILTVVIGLDSIGVFVNCRQFI